MIDRQLIGDIGLAVLLAFPTLPLARPQPAISEERQAVSPLMAQAALVQSTTERRFSLES